MFMLELFQLMEKMCIKKYMRITQFEKRNRNYVFFLKKPLVFFNLFEITCRVDLSFKKTISCCEKQNYCSVLLNYSV